MGCEYNTTAKHISIQFKRHLTLPAHQVNVTSDAGETYHLVDVTVVAVQKYTGVGSGLANKMCKYWTGRQANVSTTDSPYCYVCTFSTPLPQNEFDSIFAGL